MDAKAKSKAVFRAKVNAKKQEKQRIVSPLVRYNEHDQVICRVCDVAIKSESLWPAHQASRKHHEAVNKLKAQAADASNAKLDSARELQMPKPEPPKVLNNKSEPSSVLSGRSSTLPPDFYDNNESKRQETGKDSSKIRNPDSVKNDSRKTQVTAVNVFGNGADGLSSINAVQTINSELHVSQKFNPVSRTTAGFESKQANGALPEGFYDNKDADMQARGIKIVKPDVKDEYKEFEKQIQEDLKVVDNRLEEDEFDAAEMIEEEGTAEQMEGKKRIDMLKRKKLELKASRSAGARKKNQVIPIHEESSSDDEDENLNVDWRAKHL